MTITTDRYMNLVSSECERIIGDRLIPPAIVDALTDSDFGGKYQLFGDHPVTLATLPLAAYEAAGGEDASVVAAVGAAMEFLLTAGDVLDDLQDGDLKLADSNFEAALVEATELITALLLLAEHAILSIDSGKIELYRILRCLRGFSEFKLKAFSGQYADAHAQDSALTTPRQVVDRTQLKSGSLGKCAGMLGATLATDDVESIRDAAEFGNHLGIVYQLKNDIFDLWPGHGSMDDATSGKATAPTAFTLAVDNGEVGNSATSRLFKNSSEFPEDIEKARRETFASGGMHFAIIQSFAHLARTKTIALRMKERCNTGNLELMMANL